MVGTLMANRGDRDEDILRNCRFASSNTMTQCLLLIGQGEVMPVYHLSLTLSCRSDVPVQAMTKNRPAASSTPRTRLVVRFIAILLLCDPVSRPRQGLTVDVRTNVPTRIGDGTPNTNRAQYLHTLLHRLPRSILYETPSFDLKYRDGQGTPSENLTNTGLTSSNRRRACRRPVQPAHRGLVYISPEQRLLIPRIDVVQRPLPWRVARGGAPVRSATMEHVKDVGER